MSELTIEKIYKNELIKAGASGNNNLERIRNLAGGGGGSEIHLYQYWITAQSIISSSFVYILTYSIKQLEDASQEEILDAINIGDLTTYDEFKNFNSKCGYVFDDSGYKSALLSEGSSSLKNCNLSASLIRQIF